MEIQKWDAFGVLTLAYNGTMGNTSWEKGQILNAKFSPQQRGFTISTAHEELPYPAMDQILITVHRKKEDPQKI